MIQLDLSKILKMDKPTPVAIQPEIVGLVVTKSDNLEEIKLAVTKAGLDFQHTEDRNDGTTILKASAEPLNLEGVAIFKMSDETVLLMKGFDPYGDTMTFMEAANAQGFYPAMSNAFDAFRTVAFKALRESGDPMEATKKMEGFLGEFSAYVLDAASKIPAVAFKADNSICEVVKAGKVKLMTPEEMKAKGATDAEIAAYMEKHKEHMAMKNEAVVEAPVVDTPVVEVPAPVAPTPAPVNTPDIAEIVKAALEAGLAPITNAIAAVNVAVADVTKSVKDVATAQTSLEEKVLQVETVAKSASAAMSGVVVGHQANDDANRLANAVAKSEDDNDPFSGQFDTAYIRKSVKQPVVNRSNRNSRN